MQRPIKGICYSVLMGHKEPHTLLPHGMKFEVCAVMVRQAEQIKLRLSVVRNSGVAEVESDSFSQGRKGL